MGGAKTTAGERPAFTREGWHTVTPWVASTDPSALVQLIKLVFDATGEYRPGAPAILRIGDHMIMISDAAARGAMPASLYVYLRNADETHRRAVAARALSLEEPFDVPYGDRRAIVADRCGNTWQIATRLAEGHGRTERRLVRRSTAFKLSGTARHPG